MFVAEGVGSMAADIAGVAVMAVAARDMLLGCCWDGLDVCC